MSTILVTGSRRWTDKDTIREYLVRESSQLTPPFRLVHGACRGADVLAGEVAKELGWDVMEYPADWETHGTSAGAIRSMKMIQSEAVDLVLGFSFGERSRGTNLCVRMARRAGIKTVKLTACDPQRDPRG